MNTLEEIRLSDKTFLSPADISPVLGSDLRPSG